MTAKVYCRFHGFKLVYIMLQDDVKFLNIQIGSFDKNEWWNRNVFINYIIYFIFIFFINRTFMSMEVARKQISFWASIENKQKYYILMYMYIFHFMDCVSLPMLSWSYLLKGSMKCLVELENFRLFLIFCDIMRWNSPNLL